MKKTPMLVPIPVTEPEPTETQGLFFGVIKTDAGWSPVSMEFPSKRVVFLADAMPYKALAYVHLQSAIQDHYARESRK